MPVFRINKTKNYTVMSNQHLKNKNLSLKAKGLLSMMLSFPDDWDYSINGLISICKESETSIKSTLKELKELKYLMITKEKDNKGKFTYIYNIYECPEGDFPPLDNPTMENDTQLNINNKKLKNKKKINKRKSADFQQREYSAEELENLYINKNI